MKQSEATELLDQRLKTVWAVANPSVPYALNNETFRPASLPFVRFFVLGVTAEQRSMGAIGRRRFEYKATFVAQICGDLDAGTKPVDLLVDSVRETFQGLHLSTAGDPLWTKAASAPAPVTRDGLFIATVAVPFTFFGLG